MNNKKLIVIGGGAAGFFCAINAARLLPGLQVTILEKSSKLLSKVKISGGGRCNVTHACFSIAEMVKKYPRGEKFLKKAFHQFFTVDTIEWFNERRVKLATEADGRMFPVTNTSQTIIDCLLGEAGKYGVQIVMNAEVKNVSSVKQKERISENQFGLLLGNGNVLHADYVCIACGGYSKAAQFSWLTEMGHNISSPVPSLFTFNMPKNAITRLMGITVDNVVIRFGGSKLQQSGPLLITHWGLSGPAVLKLSAWGAREFAERHHVFNIIINWLPEFNEGSLKEKFQQLRFDIATQKLYNRNPFSLPARLWEYFLQYCGIAEALRWADLPAKEQNKLIKTLCSQEFTIEGKATFKEEFVTAGGVKLDEVDVNTMQSKLIPNLFFAGEVLDIDGVTGGFNFQNAWTTGWIAAKGVVSVFKASE